MALVGYTNAGKSSWFNALTDSETYEENQLFATLDSKSKMLQINEGFKLLLSDTVGFIQQLPTHLIEAFSSTLEEAKYADLLIHVVDRSHPNYEGHIKTVNALLTELDMGHIPVLFLLNKKDLMTEDLGEDSFDTLYVSSRIQDDQRKVKKKLIELIKQTMSPYQISIDSNEGREISILKQETLTESIEYNEQTNQYDISGYEQQQAGIIKRIREKSEHNE